MSATLHCPLEFWPFVSTCHYIPFFNISGDNLILTDTDFLETKRYVFSSFAFNLVLQYIF